MHPETNLTIVNVRDDLNHPHIRAYILTHMAQLGSWLPNLRESTKLIDN